MPRTFTFALACLLCGCAGGQHQRPIGGELHQLCSEPRSQVCTREYAPVCAFLPREQRREYSNGCTACADSAVSGYIAGSCPAR